MGSSCLTCTDTENSSISTGNCRTLILVVWGQLQRVMSHLWLVLQITTSPTTPVMCFSKRMWSLLLWLLSACLHAPLLFASIYVPPDVVSRHEMPRRSIQRVVRQFCKVCCKSSGHRSKLEHMLLNSCLAPHSAIEAPSKRSIGVPFNDCVTSQVLG
jgi:hypothetical protein